MKYIAIILSLLATLPACRKESVDEPRLQVALGNTTIKAGDTVRFVLSGQADIVTFYSGEEGHRYEHRNRAVLEGVPALTFSTQSTNATQPSFSVLLSTNFSGAYDTANIRAANWQDVTSRFTLSTGTANTPSGTLDLKEYLKPNLPLFVAFRYNAAATFGQGAWIVQSFDLSMKGADQVVHPVADLVSAAWIARDFSNTNIKWTIATNQLSITGRVSAPHVASEDWLISKALYVDRATPDVGLPVKDVSIALSDYEYVFTEPGDYTVTFVGLNTFGYAQKEAVTTLKVTVQP